MFTHSSYNGLNSYVCHNFWTATRVGDLKQNKDVISIFFLSNKLRVYSVAVFQVCFTLLRCKETSTSIFVC